MRKVRGDREKIHRKAVVVVEIGIKVGKPPYALCAIYNERFVRMNSVSCVPV